MTGEQPRFVLHLPFTASSLEAAKRFARTAGRSLAFLTQLDVPETTVSEEDNQGVRHRIYCDRLLTGGRRCALRAEHPNDCTTVPG
ncbi:hypothetical protein O7626_24630 [Micromonospora sp. WMMD1102]|uniref:hypothetical protein n=1 Tax=Micromonospora sp. WMMD1102 TaxID=3016105 RepID=UPI002415122C|nr:hypothetical protein [Micromonospora sp. WMMD1102]MDG4789078.1 hypothetical protein [Micromonospora sp. WMMD1102]